MKPLGAGFASPRGGVGQHARHGAPTRTAIHRMPTRRMRQTYPRAELRATPFGNRAPNSGCTARWLLVDWNGATVTGRDTMTGRTEFTIPPPLTPGSHIRVVAPSGPFDRTLVLRAIGFLSERYRVEFDWSLFDREGMFAGSDERRLDELSSALTSPKVAAIVMARGGYGLARILPRVDIAQLRESPRWFVGFSDATALHVEAARLRVASLHADNLTGLGRGNGPARSQWIAALEQPMARRTFTHLETWSRGQAVGPLVGGNLTLLFTCAAARRLVLPRGSILVVEDVTESSYRIDRMLTALLTSGALEPVAGVVVGELTDCPPGRFGVSAQEVMRERLAVLGVPVVAEFPCGHGLQNVPVPFGCNAAVDANRGTLVFNP